MKNKKLSILLFGILIISLFSCGQTTFEIIKVFNGEEVRKKITVWGYDGADCRTYLSKFKVNNYYLITFFQESHEKPLEFAISSCVQYWLDANNEKKVVIGFNNENQNQISYNEVWNYFHGEQTNELTPSDFKEIFQLALDLPKLQKYYHTDIDSTRKQVIIQNFGEANDNKLVGVSKFEKQIIIMTEEEIDNKQIKSFFVLGDWVCGRNSVRMQLSYVGENILVSYMFKKIDDKWTIVNSELWEE